MKSESESLNPLGGRNRAAAEGNCIRGDAGWGAAGGGRAVLKQDQAELDTASCAGEPVEDWRSLPRKRRDWRIPALPKTKPANATCERSRNARKVSCEKWRFPGGELTPSAEQSVHSSDETGNDGGAKGRRKANTR